MVDFNINHYLIEEKEIEKDPHRFDNFYGDIEDKPLTERELFSLQAEYLKTHDYKIWSKMFGICWSYIQSIIKKRQKGKNFIEPDVLDDMTTNATLAFMSQYLTRPDFEVGASFAGMMTWKIVEAMYKPSADDKSISLDMFVDDDNKHTLNDLIADNTSYHVSPDDQLMADSSYQIIEEVIKETEDVLGDDFYRIALINTYILLCIKHPKNRHAKRLFLSHWASDFKTEKLIEYVMLEIHKRLETGD